MNLREKGKDELLALVQETTGVRIHFVRQAYPLGLGHAVLQAKAFVGQEPFVVMLGDDLMQDEVPLAKQLINVTIALMHRTLRSWKCLMRRRRNTASSISPPSWNRGCTTSAASWKNRKPKKRRATWPSSAATC